MELVKVKTVNDIKEGDSLMITGGYMKNESCKVQKVKVSDEDGTEIILDIEQNIYFNLGRFLYNKSWVKELRKVVVIIVLMSLMSCKSYTIVYNQCCDKKEPPVLDTVILDRALFMRTITKYDSLFMEAEKSINLNRSKNDFD